MNSTQFDTLFGWNMTKVIARLKKERTELSDAHLDALEVEYKRFLSLGLTAEKGTFPISEAVDQMWHTHILFTRDYHKLSQALGRDYIHHYPILTQEDTERLTPLYITNTLREYKRLYGEPNASFWPADCVCGSCFFAGGDDE